MEAVGLLSHILPLPLRVLTSPWSPPSPPARLPFPAAEVEAKFAKSAWGQKLSKRSAKAAMSDFDRYKAAVTKMKRSAKVRKAFNALKKSAK
jgi:hypothetical protein